MKNVENYGEIKNKVRVHKDLTYPSANEKNTYDIYLPKDIDENLPTILWVHGGSFVAGSKEGIENYARMLANQGYAVVGMDYQWAPEIKYPGQATLLATNPEYEKAIGLNSTIEKDQVRGSVLYCGPFDVSKMLYTGNKQIDFFTSRIGWALLGDKNWKDGQMIKTTTIKDYVTNDFPPSLITDGNTGSFESQGKKLANILSKRGLDVRSFFFDKEKYGVVNHEYQFNIGDGGAGTYCYKNTIDFLEEIL
ncbi:MAG: alpha/beta hydrolase [Anaerococcus sp.]|nr:alpha/beta hydrolase [Anaerococcus sp.]